MRLAGAVTHGSGAANEDGFGYAGHAEDVTAAWVFDGVTGINGQNFLPAATDAAWLVACAHRHLLNLAGQDMPLRHILSRLVQGLIADWQEIAAGVNFPGDYDPPAACLVFVKRYGDAWQALRLGDSILLAKGAGSNTVLFAPPDTTFDGWLAGEARKRREAGVTDMKTLHAEFHPQLMHSRAKRNTPTGYGILEASPRAMDFAEFHDLGSPDALLLCTDGYYRAVDHYALHNDESLIAASLGKAGVDRVLRDIRAAEAADPMCLKYHRFKPADDATAIALAKETEIP